MIEIFEKLGCSSTQGKLYLLLLDLGPTIASMLAKRAGIKRVTVYGALEGLMSKGLVESFSKNNVTYYQACDPEIIVHFLDVHLEQEKKMNQRAHKKLEELKSAQQKKENIIELKGVIRYYEGKDSVKTLIDETLRLPDKIQYCIGLSGFHALKFYREWDSYIASRVKNGMKVLSIQGNTEEARSYKNRDSKELRETRLIPMHKSPDHGELNLIGDRIILYSFEENEAVGVKITHRALAKILKKLFEMCWEHAKEFESP